MQEEVQAQLASTGEPVTITANMPHSKQARAEHDMTHIQPDTLLYSPKTGLVETAATALTQANTPNNTPPTAYIPHLNRQAWETLFNDANVAVCELVDPQVVAGRHVLERRRALGLDQPQLAKHLGVSQPTVSQWETGVRPLPDRMKQAIFDLEIYQEALTDVLVQVLIGEAQLEDLDPPLFIDETDPVQTVARARAYRKVAILEAKAEADAEARARA